MNKVVILTGDTFRKSSGSFVSLKPDVSFVQKVWGKTNVFVLGPSVNEEMPIYNTEISRERFLSLPLEPSFTTKSLQRRILLNPSYRKELFQAFDKIIEEHKGSYFWVRLPSAASIFFAARVILAEERLICHIAGDASLTWQDEKYKGIWRYIARFFSWFIQRKIKNILKYNHAIVFCSGHKLLKTVRTLNLNSDLLVDTVIESSDDGIVSVGDVINFVFVGRIVADKGIFLILGALRTILDTGCPTIHVSFVGSGKDLASLKLKIFELDVAQYVTLNGVVVGEDLAKVYKNADVVLVPTKTNEGLPRVIYEGFAYGIPCIVSDVGGMPHAVNNGIDGLVIERNNEEALVEAMSTLMQREVLKSFKIEATKRKFRSDFGFWKNLVLHRVLDDDC